MSMIRESQVSEKDSVPNLDQVEPFAKPHGRRQGGKERALLVTSCAL